MANQNFFGARLGSDFMFAIADAAVRLKMNNFLVRTMLGSAYFSGLFKQLIKIVFTKNLLDLSSGSATTACIKSGAFVCNVVVSNSVSDPATFDSVFSKASGLRSW